MHKYEYYCSIKIIVTFFFQDKLLLNQQGCNIKETARRMIKRVFDKELAIQFSLTGLGAGRIRNKLSFIDNDVSKHILGKEILSIYHKLDYFIDAEIYNYFQDCLTIITS